MKEIFIGFCSDFKWICGSILNGKVRQSQPRRTFARAQLPSLRLYGFYSNLYVYFSYA